MTFKPINQAIPHDPDNGKYGDCYPACIASVLGIPLSEIPHFYGEGRVEPEAGEIIDEFFKSRNLSVCTLNFPGSTLKEVLLYCGLRLPNALYIMSAGSPRFSEIKDGNELCRHAVVGCGGVLIHDPHPDKTFVTNVPKTDGWGVSIEVYSPYMLGDDEKFDFIDSHAKAC